MFKSNLLKISVLSLFAASAGSAAPLKISNCSVNFLAQGKPGFLKINGTGADCKGNLENDGKALTGDITVPMAKFATGIDMRDEHMRKNYFEVAKYPDAVLKLTKFDTSGKDGDAKKPFKGTLNFHGSEKPVEGTASFKNDGGKSFVEAEFPIGLEEFKITVPKYAGVTVADTVTVTTKFETTAAVGAPATNAAAKKK